MLGSYLTSTYPRGVWGENETSLLQGSKWRTIRTMTARVRVVPNPQRHEIEMRCYPKANNKDRGKPRLSVLPAQERNKITQEHWRG